MKSVLLLLLVACGGGEAGAPDAALPGTPPSTPTFVRLTPGDTTMTVAWATNPEADVVRYEVREGGNVTKVSAPLTFATVTDLVNGTEARFEVAAIDADGERSPWSAPISGFPSPPDATPPQVFASQPADGEVGVDPVLYQSVVQIQLDERVDRASLVVRTTPAFALGPPTWVVDDTIVRFTPAGRFAPATHYLVELEVRDLAGNRVTRAFAFDTLVPLTPPVVTAITPEGTGVPITAPIVVRFSQAMDRSSVIITLSPVVALTCDQWDAASTRVSCSHPALAGSTGYTLLVHGEARGANQVALGGGDVVATFTTGAAPDTTAPTVVSTSPASGAVAVPLEANLCVTFSEPMNQAATEAAFSIPSPPERNAGTFSWPSPSTMCFDGTSPIAYNDEVTLTVGTGAKDLAGNALATPLSVTFRAWRLVSHRVIADSAVTQSDAGLLAEAYAGYGGLVYGRLTAVFTFHPPPLPPGGELVSASLYFRQSATPQGDPYVERTTMTPTPIYADAVALSYDGAIGARSVDWLAHTVPGSPLEVRLASSRVMFYALDPELTFWDAGAELRVSYSYPSD